MSRHRGCEGCAVIPTPSIPQTIVIYRQKYPEGLLCTSCGRLLATRRESYRSSNLTEAQRLEYVCSECRLAARDVEQVLEARLAHLAAARAIASERRSKQVALVPTRIST